MGSSDYGIGDLISAFGQQEAAKKAGHEQRKTLERQYELQGQFLQEMFPLITGMQNLGMGLLTGDYGGMNINPDVIDFLSNPIAMTNLENSLFAYAGGIPPKGFGGGTRKKPYQTPEDWGLGRQQMEEAVGLLESLRPYGEEWAKTGFLTPIDPYEQYALRLFNREMVPDIAERFGSNITGSGFQNALAGAAGDVSSELGALAVGLQEAATGRRIQGLSGPIASLFTAPADYQRAFEQWVGDIGEQWRLRKGSTRPGAWLWGALPTLAGLSTQQGFLQSGFPTSGTDMGNMFSALGMSGLGTGIGKAIESIPWDKIFGGGTELAPQSTYGVNSTPFWGGSDYGSSDALSQSDQWYPGRPGPVFGGAQY